MKARAIALGSLHMRAERVAVSYLLPVAVPGELRQPGAEQLTEAVIGFSIAEAAAEMDVSERTADCSVSGLRFSHEAGSSGAVSTAASESSAAAPQTGADYARRAWDSTAWASSQLASGAPDRGQPGTAQRDSTSLLQVRFATVLLRRVKRLVWVPGSAPADRSDGGRLGFDVTVVDPELSFSTDAAFAMLAVAVEVSQAVTLATARPTAPVTVSPSVSTAAVPAEVKQATVAAVASAGEAIQRAHREGRARGSVRVVGAHLQLPLNDGYTWAATVSVCIACCACRRHARLPSSHLKDIMHAAK